MDCSFVKTELYRSGKAARVPSMRGAGNLAATPEKESLSGRALRMTGHPAGMVSGQFQAARLMGHKARA